MRRRLPDALIIGLLFILPLMMFWAQTIGGKTLLPTENLYQYEPYATYREVVNAPEIPQNHLLSDLVLQNYQWKSFIRQNIEDGEIPLWNPRQFSGIPFMAAGQQSTLYPLSILYYVMPLPAAYGWFTVINLWLAGVFMYTFMRGLGIKRTGATISGITYQLCGFFIASVVFPMIIGAIVWLPLLLLMAEFIIRRKPFFGRESSIPWVAVGAIALGCNILAGHVEITIYTLLILGYYSAMRLMFEYFRKHRAEAIRESPLQERIIKPFAWLAVMIILGFGLGAIQFIPLFEFANSNWRAERSSVDTVMSYAHPARDALQFAMPNFYGSPAQHSYYDVFSMETVPVTVNALGEAITHTEWGIKNYVEGALYVGIMPLVLAVFGLFDALWVKRGRKSYMVSAQYKMIFALLGLISLTLMFGLPTYRLIYPLPGINQLNSPFRWVFGMTVAVAILAGFGANALEKMSNGEKTQLWAKRFAYGLIIVGLLILFGLLTSYLFFDQIESSIQKIVDSMVNASNVFSDAKMFFSYQFKNVLIFGLMTLGSGVVFLAATKDWVIRTRYISSLHVWKILAIGLVAIDLMVASWGFNPASDPALLDFTPPSIEWLLDQQEQDGPFRYFRYTTLENPSAHTSLLQPNMTMRYGLDDMRGYDSIISLQYVDYMRETYPQGMLDYNRIAPMYADQLEPQIWENIDWIRLRLLNLRYLITHKSTTLPDTLTDNIGREPSLFDLEYEDEAVRIWRNNYVYPRAFITYPYTDDLMPSIKEIPYISYRGDGWRWGDAIITYDSGREKLIDTRHERAAWLVISDTYAPGWRAFIRPLGADDDEEEQIDTQVVLENFIGVDLRDIPAGQYTVRVVYSPMSFQVGFFGSVMSAALLMLLVGIWLWQLMVGTSDEDSSTVSRVARNSIAPIILNLFNRGLDFAFAFVMLRILGPEDAGIYYYAIIIFVWFDIFTNFGLDVFLIREASRQREKAGYFLLNTSYFRIFMIFACIPLLLGFLLIRQSALSDPLPARGLLAIGLLYIGLAPGSINKGLTSLFYGFERAEYPAAVTTISTMSKSVLGLVALLFGYGIVGLAAASIITNFVTLAILLHGGRKLIKSANGRRENATLSSDEKQRLSPDGKLIKNMVTESWPLMLNHFLATIFFQIDIVLLEAIKGAIIVGKYSVSYRWLLALNIIPAFFTQALLPVMSRQAKEDRPALKRTYTLGIKLLVMLATPLAVLFTFWANWLTLFLGGAEYMPEGALALQIMIWSIPIGWINSLTQYTLIAVDLQRKITRAFIVAVTFNIVTNLIFIPQYGYQAAAITTIFSELVLLIPFMILLQSALGKLNWVDMVWRSAMAGLMMMVVMLITWEFMPFLAFILGTSLYIGLMVILKPLNTEEQKMLTPILPGRLKRKTTG